jgi:hypothetical protein
MTDATTPVPREPPKAEKTAVSSSCRREIALFKGTSGEFKLSLLDIVQFNIMKKYVNYSELKIQMNFHFATIYEA